MSKVYLVYGSRGEYSDYMEWSIKAFHTQEAAEKYLTKCENYLIDNGLFEKFEEETWWGRRVRWRKSEAWDWGEWKEIERLDRLAKENPFDPKEPDELTWLNGYFWEDIEVED